MCAPRRKAERAELVIGQVTLAVGRSGVRRRAGNGSRRLSAVATRSPARPSHSGIAAGASGAAPSSIVAISAGSSPSSTFVPCVSVDDALGGAAQRVAADAERGGLVLHAAGVGQDRARDLLEREEVEVAERAASRARRPLEARRRRPVGSIRRARARVQREHDRHALGELRRAPR